MTEVPRPSSSRPVLTPLGPDPAEPEARPALTQRALVEASLLRCPEADDEPPEG